MPYTFVPKFRHAKAYGSNLRVSAKSAAIICAAIRDKPLTRAKRLLVDLKSGRRNLKGKYYSGTVEGLLQLLESAEKNAENLGLESERLFVHASAHKGMALRRRRRKSGFGSKLKTANVEIMLIECGKADDMRRKEKLKEAVKTALTKEVQKMKEKGKEIEMHAHEAPKADAEREAAARKAEKDIRKMEEKGVDKEIKEMKKKEKEIEDEADLLRAKQKSEEKSDTK